MMAGRRQPEDDSRAPGRLGRVRQDAHGDPAASRRPHDAPRPDTPGAHPPRAGARRGGAAPATAPASRATSPTCTSCRGSPLPVFTLAPLAPHRLLSFYEWDGLTPGGGSGSTTTAIWCGRPTSARPFEHSLELILFYAVVPILHRPAADGAPARAPRARVHVLPHGAVPAADDRDRRRRAGVDVDLRPRGPLNECSPHRARLAGARRPGSATSPGRSPRSASSAPGSRSASAWCSSSPACRGSRPDAVRRGARRRRGLRARVLRRHAAGAAERARRRCDADDDHRAAQLRHRLQHDGRRAGRRDRGAVVADVPRRLRDQPGRLAASIATCSRSIIIVRRARDRRFVEAHGDDRAASTASDDLHRADRVLGDRALPADLDPLPRVPQEDRPRRPASRCRRRSASQTFVDAWNEGDFASGMWGSFLVAASVTVVSAVLSLFMPATRSGRCASAARAPLQPDRAAG